MARWRKAGELVRADGYAGLLTGISHLLEQARRSAARSVNSILSAAYWEIGRRIVEYEQAGRARAEYGESLLKKLGKDLTAQHGRGFSWRNLFSMRRFSWAGKYCRHRLQYSRFVFVYPRKIVRHRLPNLDHQWLQ